MIIGRVQGVYYRSYARAEAEKLDLYGWIRNSVGGSVEMVIEGRKEDIEAMIVWCRKGSPSAQVAAVRVDWQEFKGEFDRFYIEYTRY